MSEQIAIPERQTYVPVRLMGKECFHHADDSKIEVRGHGGAGLGFFVADVLPERRWAIATDGEVMPQIEFERAYREWASYVSVSTGQVIPITSVNKYFDPTREPIPNVVDWVSQTIDEFGSFIPIGFDPRSAPEKRAEAVHNHLGEKGAAETRPPRSFDAVRGETEEEMRGRIREEIRAELAAAPAPKPDPSPLPVAPEMATATCGKLVKKRGLKAHAKWCVTCGGSPPARRAV